MQKIIQQFKGVVDGQDSPLPTKSDRVLVQDNLNVDSADTYPTGRRKSRNINVATTSSAYKKIENVAIVETKKYEIDP